MSESENLWLDDKFGLAYDNELMQKKMINIARNLGYDDGKEAGKVEGIKEGKKEEKVSIAKNLLKDGIPIDVVSRNTGLSEEELNKLNN